MYFRHCIRKYSNVISRLGLGLLKMSEPAINRAEIAFSLEGFPEDGGHVDFSVFAAQVRRLSDILEHIDNLRPYGTGKKIRYRVVRLSHSSPATIFLQPVLEEHELNDPDNGVNTFISIVNCINSNGELPPWVDRPLLKKIRSLNKPVGRSVCRSWLRFAGQEIAFSRDTSDRIRTILTWIEVAEGSLKGRVEAIYLHRGCNVFYLYPESDYPRVTCHFPAKMREESLSAIDNLAIVTGRMEYKRGSISPHKVQVREIDVIRDPDSLPTLKDLRGIAPDLTGGLNSVDYVRRVRNEWEG